MCNRRDSSSYELFIYEKLFKSFSKMLHVIISDGDDNGKFFRYVNNIISALFGVYWDPYIRMTDWVSHVQSLPLYLWVRNR